MEETPATPPDKRGIIWFYSKMPTKELQGNREAFDRLVESLDGYLDESSFSEALRLFKIIEIKLPAEIAAIEGFSDYPDLSEEDARELINTLTSIGSDSDYKIVIDRLLARFSKIRREKLGISLVEPT